ncbi:MAG: hypothetical protein KC619_19625 [Myxococcales bacterium]|nr:hypothetical protein [Myxococcales bacterium]
MPLNIRQALALGGLLTLMGCDGSTPADPDGGTPRVDAGGGFDGGPDFDAALPDAGPGPEIDAGGPVYGEWAPQPWEDCEGGGSIVEAGPDDYRAALDALGPGDTLRLQPGDYTRGLPITVSGEEGRCIVIEALDPAARPRFFGSDAFNIIAIHGASWVKVRHLDIDGIGRAGFGVASQGGDAMPTHHVVIEDLSMVGLDADQQIVGVSTKSPAWDWVIRGNRIVGAGTGMYLGNSDGTQPFVRGVIELNTILDTIGYSAQIKHQLPRPDLPGMPADGAATIIRYNVFSKGAGSSTGAEARPNLLIGHLPASGAGVNDRYLVYGNLFYDNPTENLMQAEGNLAIYRNVFVNPNGGALTVQPHNAVPRLVDVFLNTVLASGRGIDVSGGDPGFAQRVRYNAVFSPTPIRADDQLGDVTGDMLAAVAMLTDAAAPPGAGLDLHPADDALTTSIDPAELPDVLDATFDYDQRRADPPTRAGAYDAPTTARSVPLALEARTP